MTGESSGRDRGSLAIEAALVVPVVLGLLVLVLAAGRMEETAGTVQEAARAGARAASIAKQDIGDQTAAADQAVQQVLGQGGVHCPGPPVVRVEQLSAQPPLSDVLVEVTCDVPVNDLSPVWVPGRVTMQGTFRSVIDQYRST